jgi:hypothetical protein
MSSPKSPEDIIGLLSNRPFTTTSNPIPGSPFSGNLFSGGTSQAPSLSHEDAITRMMKTNVNKYKKGNTTFTWVKDSYDSASGSVSPHDGQSQVRMDVDHSKSWSTRTTYSPDNNHWTFGTGSKDNAAKWRRDGDGAEFTWEHKVHHNGNLTSHLETGIKNTNSGPMAIFKWALGYNSK